MRNTMSDNDLSDSEREWWARAGEVLRHERTGELHHVTSRYENADDERRLYEVWDDTHTTRERMYAEDVRSEFEKTDVVVFQGVKPLQRLDGRLYGNAGTDTEP